jgi:hypothetical protein
VNTRRELVTPTKVTSPDGLPVRRFRWLRTVDRVPTPPSPVELEIVAMQAAARIRSLVNAAEDYLDVLIREQR